VRVLANLRVTVVCVAALALPLGGCAADSGVDPATSAPAPGKPTPAASQQLANPDSAASTVMKFWESVQRGALPLTLSLYEPRVVAAVGVPTFAGMLAQQRPVAEAARLNVLRVEGVSRGELITAETIPKAGPKVQHSFFLRPRGRRSVRWRILYDTISAAAIPAYVQDQTQRSINPTAATPSRSALAAADRVGEAYRRAALVPVAVTDTASRRATPAAGARPGTTTTP
jgi:hypothetical protein